MNLREKLIELLGGSAQDDSATGTSESGDDEREEVIDECPAGGDHEWKDVWPATSRVPLFTYCTKCRQQRS